jgi:hypothetical protein
MEVLQHVPTGIESRITNPKAGFGPHPKVGANLPIQSIEYAET